MKYKVTFPDINDIDYGKCNEFDIVKCLQVLMPNLDFRKAYVMAKSKGMYILDFDPRSGNKLTQEFHDAIAGLQRNCVELEYHWSSEDEELAPDPKVDVENTDPCLEELRTLTKVAIDRKNYKLAHALVDVLAQLDPQTDY